MVALQVALHPFGAKHPAIEGKFLPGLETDHPLILDLELNPALDPAKAAMRLDEPVGFDGFPPAIPRRVDRMRTVGLDEGLQRKGQRSHG
jgi:hypothetical protein